MKFLTNNNSLFTYFRSRLWFIPATHGPCTITETLKFKRKSNTNNGRLTSVKQVSLIPWTQVRFKDEKYTYPRLHGDINYPNFDNYRRGATKDLTRTSYGVGDDKPGSTYVISVLGTMAGAYAVKSVLTYLVTYMSASADVLALATIEVNVSNIGPGACLTFKWRGKPLFVKSRTSVEIDAEINTDISTLRDPQTQEQRCLKPEWLIVVGICTHLGCVPIPNTGDYVGGFYCPCHGSHYDNIGRARKGPAPLNLEVPPHKYLTDTTILIG